jgi:TolA-binding protein
LLAKHKTWKGDFEKAKNTLDYVLLQFPNTPIWFEAQVWLARIAVITGDYVDAQDRLKSIEANRRKPKNKEFKASSIFNMGLLPLKTTQQHRCYSLHKKGH